VTSPDRQDRPSADNSEPPAGSHQDAARPSRSRHRLSWVWLSVIALVALSAALLTYGFGSTRGAASSGSAAVPGGTAGAAASTSGGAAPKIASTAASTSRGAAPRVTGKAAGGVISAANLAEKGGAVSPPTNMNSELINWQSGSGGKHLSDLSSGLGDALQAAGIRQYAPMKHACAQLAGSVATAEAGPQIPYAAMQMLYARALAELAKGAADCQTAISFKPSGDESVATHVDPTLLHQSVSELSAGATDVFRSTAEIAILSRQGH
jgi:hypothetical protein